MNLFKNLATLLCVAFLLATSTANASEGGSKDSLNAKMEPIVVNLMGSEQQVIRVELVLQLAKQEVSEIVKLYMPVIRHKMILLLTSKDANQLGSFEGKQRLVMESKNAINQALGILDYEGVADVLFASFIIQ